MHVHAQILKRRSHFHNDQDREWFWIPPLRRHIKAIDKKFMSYHICQVFQVTAPANPQTESYPGIEQNENAPKLIKVDFAGPFSYLSNNNKEMKGYSLSSCVPGFVTGSQH